MRIIFYKLGRSSSGGTLLVGLFIFSLLLPARGWSQKDGEPAFGTISARVAKEELGKTGAGVAAFFSVDGGPPPRPGQLRRVPDKSTDITANGSLEVLIPPGQYYIGIILDRSMNTIGPPSPGEKTFVAHDSTGQPKVFTVVSGLTTDAGLLSGKVPDEKNSPLPEYFTIEGSLLDQKGNPVPTAVILVFKANDASIRPVYLHQVTSKDGHYSLRLATGSSYNLMVRSTLGGGQPTPGEQIGRYDEESMKEVTAKKGEVLKDINIKLLKVPEPGESGQKYLKKPGKRSMPQPSSTITP